MTKWMAGLGLLLTLAACSTSPSAGKASRDIEAGVCGWKFAGDADFEAQTPGAGRASHYTCFIGARATIYRYGLGRQDWTVAAPDFVPAVRASAADALAFYKNQRATATTAPLGADGGSALTLHGRPFHGYRFDITQSSGERHTSYLLMTTADGLLLKYRVTFNGAHSELYARIVSALVKATLPAEAPAAAPVSGS